jgi:hypothetical protein
MAEISEQREKPDNHLGTAAQLKRSLQTLYRWSRLTFEASSELELLQSTCQILVETEELRLAWIGYCTDKPKELCGR